MNEAQKVRVACVGAGYFSRFHYEAWKRIAGVDLVASVNRNIDRARETGLEAFDDLSEMIEQMQPDLVDIITPPVTHLESIKTCVANGVRTIICQKPFCENIVQAQEAIEFAENAGVTLIVHENFRFQPWFRQMKKALDRKLIGDVHQLTFRARPGDGQGPKAYLDRQPYFQEMERFFIHETGVHWVDTFRYLLGEPVAVYADLRKLNPAIAGEDAAYVILEFTDGVRAIIDGNRHLDHSADNCRHTFGEALLEGTKGTVSLSGSGEVSFREFGSQINETILGEKDYLGFAGDCVHALQSHVIDHLHGKASIENSARDYMRVLHIEKQIYHSAETGQRIEL